MCATITSSTRSKWVIAIISRETEPFSTLYDLSLLNRNALRFKNLKSNQPKYHAGFVSGSVSHEIHWLLWSESKWFEYFSLISKMSVFVRSGSWELRDQDPSGRYTIKRRVLFWRVHQSRRSEETLFCSDTVQFGWSTVIWECLFSPLRFNFLKK